VGTPQTLYAEGKDGSQIAGVEELAVSQPADRAGRAVGGDDALPELRLVEPLHGETGHVRAARLWQHVAMRSHDLVQVGEGRAA